MTHNELKALQALPLEIKVQKSKQRIREFYERYQGDVYISFSGGVDSTVLRDIARQVYPDIESVFVNTGLEFPEVVSFVQKQENVTILRPIKTFYQIIKEYGYPYPSKEQAQYISEYINGNENMKKLRMEGNKWGKGKIDKKYYHLLEAPFKVSAKCCFYLKKQPLLKYERESHLKPIVGIMADDSFVRKQTYLRHGCNAFEASRPISRPIGFWRDQDIWEYIKTYNVEYSSIYDKGYIGTGCMFCLFGINSKLEKEKNRFQRMRETHPQLHNYCINKLNIKQVLDYEKIPY